MLFFDGDRVTCLLKFGVERGVIANTYEGKHLNATYYRIKLDSGEYTTLIATRLEHEPPLETLARAFA